MLDAGTTGATRPRRTRRRRLTSADRVDSATDVKHQFDAGSFFPSRAPFLLLQFSGDFVATIGFEAKLGFECELSDWFRRNHRIKIPIRNIGPVPVDIYLEPTLKFSVSATGDLHVSRRHYFIRAAEAPEVGSSLLFSMVYCDLPDPPPPPPPRKRPFPSPRRRSLRKP